VHEKSILLPLVPALMLLDSEQWAVSWLVQVALFSNYPLLFRDGQRMPYWVLAVGWSFLRGCPACPADAQTPRLVARLQWVSTLVMLAIHAGHALLAPPPSLPDLYVVLNVEFSCAMFAAFFLYFNYRQFVCLRPRAAATAAAAAKQKTS
ncbi:Glucosyltransferase-like protein, partial [Coemansia helicoidea]